MLNGYIKYHRSLLVWEHYKDLYTSKLFEHFLLTANIKDTKYMGFLIPRGSLVVRESKIGDECGLTYQEVRTSIKKLLKSGEIMKKSTNKFTIINVVNFNAYQSTDEEHQRTTNEQLTNNQRTINELSTSIEEEDKEGKKKKKERSYNPPISPRANEGDNLVALVDEFTEDEELRTTLIEFIEHRMSMKKPLTELALRKILNQLKKWDYSTQQSIDCLNQSIMSRWQGIFELKTIGQYNPAREAQAQQMTGIEKLRQRMENEIIKGGMM